MRTAVLFAVMLSCGRLDDFVDASMAPPDAADVATSDVALLDGSYDAAPGLPGKDASVGLDDGGGLFDCHGCPCDGRTHYCDIGYGPGGAPIDAGDAADAAGLCQYSSCTPVPDGCVPAQCSCIIGDQAPCACYHADSGDGLMAGCFYP